MRQELSRTDSDGTTVAGMKQAAAPLKDLIQLVRGVLWDLCFPVNVQSIQDKRPSLGQ